MATVNMVKYHVYKGIYPKSKTNFRSTLFLHTKLQKIDSRTQKLFLADPYPMTQPGWKEHLRRTQKALIEHSATKMTNN
ncbi:hypothetical protein AJ78_02889 [Emergomyces pasteurianus Ep9510]|uniref:Uncharacterized protein n=1 Tax=Emergomyces pasteurianus Ep9510 TaxID=1447872 RepID=A0A1J9PKH4_9EURO|nr:hypothetical protein AJ78_02889 [Emergomyces pasteurianus Ep9510]